MNAVIGVFLSGVLAGSFIVLGDIFVALGASAFLSRILIGVVATFVVLPLGYPADIGRLSIGSSFSLVAFSCLAVLQRCWSIALVDAETGGVGTLSR